MGLLDGASDFFSGLFGGFTSGAAQGAASGATGTALGGGGATTPTEQPGFFGRLGSGIVSGLTDPKTILGGISLLAGSSAQDKAAQKQLDQTQALAQTKFDQELQILNLKHQQDLEILRLKGAGGGGGGGGGASLALANAQLALERKKFAQAKALAKVEAMQAAKRMELDSTLAAGDSTQKAIQNMLVAATSPLGR